MNQYKKIIFNIAIFISALSFLNISSAQEIACPQIATIKANAYKIDTATIEASGATTASSPLDAFVENGYRWEISVRNLIASSKTKAISLGQKIASNIETVLTPTVPEDKFLYCIYHPGYVLVIGHHS